MCWRIGMKRFSLLTSLAAAVVWLLPVAGPFAGMTDASVITTGDVDPGGGATQPDPWTVGGNLYVGKTGPGTLDVADGGEVSSSFGFIGSLSGSTGVATIAGSGSQWNNNVHSHSGLYIGGTPSGAGGSGTLNLYDSGLVTVSDITKLWSMGTLNLDGGSLTTGSFDNSEAGAFNFHDGTLKVNGAGGSFDPGTTDFTIDGHDGNRYA